MFLADIKSAITVMFSEHNSVVKVRKLGENSAILLRFQHSPAELCAGEFKPDYPVNKEPTEIPD